LNNQAPGKKLSIASIGCPRMATSAKYFLLGILYLGYNNNNDDDNYFMVKLAFVPALDAAKIYTNACTGIKQEMQCIHGDV